MKRKKRERYLTPRERDILFPATCVLDYSIPNAQPDEPFITLSLLLEQEFVRLVDGLPKLW